MSRIIPLITLILLALAGTVTANEREDDVAAEAAAAEQGIDAEIIGGPWHELPEADRAHTRTRVWIVGTLDFNVGSIQKSPFRHCEAGSSEALVTCVTQSRFVNRC